MKIFFMISTAIHSLAVMNVSAQQCGIFCGVDVDCESQCRGNTNRTIASGESGVDNIITSAMFDQMLEYRNDPRCKANGLYTYSGFIAATKSFPEFGTVGDYTTRRRELAAFFGQTSHETTGGWPSAPNGPYAWGYCYSRESNRDTYCIISTEFPCPAGRQYYGRGPVMLAYNFNYGRAGVAIGQDLINNPDLVATDPVTTFRTAIWFWMTPQGNRPSSHDVITGRWTPSSADVSAGRLPGYGVITNIFNGALECDQVQNVAVVSRIGFFRRYCDILGVEYGNNLDCSNQKSF